MALYTMTSWDELNSLRRPSPDQTRMYDMLGRNTGSGPSNFFERRGRSLENAFGTTGAAIASFGNDLAENARINERNRRFNQNVNDIYKEAGYNNVDDYYNAKEQAEKDAFSKIGFDIDDYWNKRADADIAGDTATIEALDNSYKQAKANLLGEDVANIARFDEIQNKLKNQTSANQKEATEAAQKYADYRKNDYISQKINQDRGKFLGSAINTLSTMSDVLLPGAGVAFNSVQGGIEGIADELEDNGLQNFDWNRAGQNALIGATTGAVTGGINRGISNQLAKNGGNLFKGGNALTRNMNKLGSETALGRVGSTLATGAGRGAVAGAVGGATGAGMSAAMNGGDVLGSAVEGAKRGLTQGAMTGGIMAGANMAANATPGVGNVMRQLNEAGDNWKQSGEDFNERLTNTLTSGDSRVGEWLQGNRRSGLLQTAGAIGNRIKDVSDTPMQDAYAEGKASFSDALNEFIEQGGNIKRGANGQLELETPQAKRYGEDVDNTAIKSENTGTMDYDTDRRIPSYGTADRDLINNINYKNGYLGENPSKSERNYYNEASRFITDIIEGKYKNATDNEVISVFRNLSPEAQENAVKMGGNWLNKDFIDTLDQSRYAPIDDVIAAANRYAETSNGKYNPESFVGFYEMTKKGSRDDAQKWARQFEAETNGRETAKDYMEFYDTINGNKIETPTTVPNSIQDAFRTIRSSYNDPTKMQLETTPEGDLRLYYNGKDTGTTIRNTLTDAQIDKMLDNGNWRGSGADFQDATGTMDNNPIAKAAKEYSNETDGRIDVDELVDFYNQTRNVPNTDVQGMAEAIELESGGRVGADELLDFVREFDKTPTTAGGWLKQAGKRILEDANDRGVGLNLKRVDTEQIPEDVATMEINTPETQMYRTLTMNNNALPQAQAEEEPFLAYGESGLATGATKKQNILSKAGRAMQAAQANATRKETRDIGIENAGELINKVRQRSGLTDLDTQAAFAKELTGGADSLLDNIQRRALSATEDGSTRMVDLTKLEPKINKLVDDLPTTLVSDKQKDKTKKAIMADLTNGGIDTITKANNFKSAAAQQFRINERTPNDSAKELGKLYTKVAELVDDVSYSAVPKELVEGMFEIGANEARGRAKVAAREGKKDIQVAYDKLADEFDESEKTIQAFRSLKKDYVDISKLNKKTQQGATAWNNSPLVMGTALTAAMASGNPLLGVPAAWLAKTTAPAIGQAAIDASAKVGGKIADWGDSISGKGNGGNVPNTPIALNDGNAETPAPINVGETGTPQTRIYDMIGRQEGLSNGEQARAADYITQATQQANNEAQGAQIAQTDIPVANQAPTASTGIYNALTGNVGTTNAIVGKSGNSYFQPTGDYWTDIIARAMTAAIDADDVAAFASLYGMYQDSVSKLQKQAESQSTSNKKITATQQRADAAMTALNELSQMEPDLGYNLSNIPVIGNIATFGGNAYEGAARSLAQQIGYMVSGANIKEEEAINIGKSYVPQPFDSAEERQRKLQRAYNIIRRYQNGYSSDEEDMA